MRISSSWAISHAGGTTTVVRMSSVMTMESVLRTILDVVVSRELSVCFFVHIMYMNLCCSSLPLLTGRWDDDCGRDQRCRDRRCKRDTRKMERCERRSDCGAHMLCKDGYCKRRDFDDIMEELAEVN